MKSSCKYIALAIWIVLFAAYSQAAPQSRMNRPIDETNVRALTGNVHPFARAQFDRGRASSAMQLGRLAIVFKPSVAQQQALQILLQQQQDPTSTNYHKWLTPEQFSGRFGMSKDDLAKVSIWLQAQGLTVLGTSRSGNEVYFTGNAGQIEYALHTELHNYSVNGEMHFANAINPSLPAAFADAVIAVKGLNDFHPQPRNVKMRRFTATSNFTSNASGNHFVIPADFTTIYDVTPLYNAGFDGTGQKIAVVGQTVIHPADIDAFRSAAALPAKNFQQILANGTAGVRTTGDEVEADLDVELSGGIAKNAAIIFVYTGTGTNNGAWDALHYIVDNNVAPVVTTSYGLCEAGNGTAFAQMVQGWAQQANAQGQTIVAAAGDQGAADCESSSSTSATTGLAVDVPASIPEVTGLGGTEFTGDASAVVTGGVAAPTQFWGGASNGNGGGTGGGSALSYIPETTWNDTAADNQLSATGGGASTIFAKPSWQTGTGVPNDSKRDVPDIALNASPDHDPYLICSQAFFTSTSTTSCSSGFRASDQSLAAVGGTSTAAPSFAAILALLNQATASSGQGNINPTLYALAASTPGAFHDISSGNNKVPCTAGSTGCLGGGMIGFSAGTGYDQVTGLGTVDAFQLVEAWPSSSLIRTPSSISLTTSNATVNAGASVTFTATVTPAAPTPTGVVQFIVDGTDTGNPVTLASGQASFTTSSLAGGAHAITAAYSGDSNYQASTSSPVTETVNVVSGFTFSLVASPINNAVTPGTSATSTITVTGGSGYSGTITYTCVVSSSTAQVGCMLSPASTSLNTSAPNGTTTLTISTTAAHVLGGLRASQTRGPGKWFAMTTSALFAGVFLFAIPSKRRNALMCLMLFAIILVAPGCGGGNTASSGSSNAPSGGTPAGNYTVTVTGSDGTNVQQATVAFTVN